jgi:3-methyl-2-oxobutanoate hydroxymethyltransferase
VLVWHDLLGLSDRTPARFVKRYAELGDEIKRALAAFASEVRSGSFPAAEHTYSIPEDELSLFNAHVGKADMGSSGRRRQVGASAQATEEHEHAQEADG